MQHTVFLICIVSLQNNISLEAVDVSVIKSQCELMGLIPLPHKLLILPTAAYATHCFSSGCPFSVKVKKKLRIYFDDAPLKAIAFHKLLSICDFVWFQLVSVLVLELLRVMLKQASASAYLALLGQTVTDVCPAGSSYKGLAAEVCTSCSISKSHFSHNFIEFKSLLKHLKTKFLTNLEFVKGVSLILIMRNCFKYCKIIFVCCPSYQVLN